MILKKVNVNNHCKNSQSEKKSVTYLINKGFINLIYKEFLKIKKKKINCRTEKWTKESYSSRKHKHKLPLNVRKVIQPHL